MDNEIHVLKSSAEKSEKFLNKIEMPQESLHKQAFNIILRLLVENT